MFEAAFDSFQKATDMTLRMQQEMFKKWLGLMPGPFPNLPLGNEAALKFQKRWSEYLEETLKRQRETLEAQYRAGLKNIEESFRLGEVKNLEELRTRTLELWQKLFDALRQAYETQTREVQTSVAGWMELISKGAA